MDIYIYICKYVYVYVYVYVDIYIYNSIHKYGTMINEYGHGSKPMAQDLISDDDLRFPRPSASISCAKSHSLSPAIRTRSSARKGSLEQWIG